MFPLLDISDWVILSGSFPTCFEDDVELLLLLELLATDDGTSFDTDSFLVFHALYSAWPLVRQELLLLPVVLVLLIR